MTDASAPSVAPARAALPAAPADYVQLLKPRVMSLVVFTGFTG
jgi:heme O synthase-like polyprenyltransferase